MTVVFARETTDLATEAIAVFREHAMEVGHCGEFSIDLDVYKRAEEAGCLRVYTAREDGLLVGYATYYLSRHSHHGTLQALQDGMYVVPKHRGHHLGSRLISWCNSQLVGDGAEHVFQSVKINHDFGPILIRLGYTPHETVYHKQLGVQH